MHAYELNEWILFFFFYCFAGWVWECCYVSVQKHHWVNRGFMHGPLLPIYGSGAVVILAATSLVEDNIFLIFLFGMCAATLLEYCTGALMERLFGVRYWDYSDQPLNLNGHICLISSLAWGGFSILMVYVIHPPVQSLIERIHPFVQELLAYGISITATVDFMQSFHEAMNLKELLQKLTESNEELLKIQERLSEVSAELEENRQVRKERWEQAQEQFVLAKEQTLERREQAKEQRKERLEQAKEQLQERFENRRTISDLINNYMERVESLPEESHPRRLELRLELSDLKERFNHLTLPSGLLRNDRRVRGSLKLLKRNPSSISSKYRNALRDIKELDNSEQQKK